MRDQRSSFCGCLGKWHARRIGWNLSYHAALAFGTYFGASILLGADLVGFFNIGFDYTIHLADPGRFITEDIQIPPNLVSNEWGTDIGAGDFVVEQGRNELERFEADNPGLLTHDEKTTLIQQYIQDEINSRRLQFGQFVATGIVGGFMASYIRLTYLNLRNSRLWIEQNVQRNQKWSHIYSGLPSGWTS